MSKPPSKSIGYKNPPKHSQFRKGQSGNPKGRPAQSLNLRTDLADELSQLILIREDGKEYHISKQRALLRAIINAAVRGDLRAAQTVAALSSKYLSEKNGAASSDNSEQDQEMLDAFIEREIARRQSLRTPSPDVSPKKTT